jgi:hypothetical protein
MLFACGETTLGEPVDAARAAATSGDASSPLADASAAAAPRAADTSDDAGPMMLECPGASFENGAEGERCSKRFLCNDKGSYGVSCVRMNGFDFDCECLNDGTLFAVRDSADCAAVSDPDFLNTQCRTRLPLGDGVTPPLVVTPDSARPAFSAAPLAASACAAASVHTEPGSCSWQADCGAVLRVECSDPLVATPSCRCLIDGQYYRGIGQGSLVCAKLDAAAAIALCGAGAP